MEITYIGERDKVQWYMGADSDELFVLHHGEPRSDVPQWIQDQIKTAFRIQPKWAKRYFKVAD